MAISKCTCLTLNWCGSSEYLLYFDLIKSYFFFLKKCFIKSQLYFGFCPEITRHVQYWGSKTVTMETPLLHSSSSDLASHCSPLYHLNFSIHFSYFKVMGSPPSKKKNTCPPQWECGTAIIIFFIFNVVHLQELNSMISENQWEFYWKKNNKTTRIWQICVYLVSVDSLRWPSVVCLNRADSQADRPMTRSIIRGEDDRTDTPRTGLDMCYK